MAELGFIKFFFVFIYDSYIHTESTCQVWRLFAERFPGGKAVHEIICKFWQTGHTRITDKKHRKELSVWWKKRWMTLATTWKISLKSIREPAQQAGITHFSMHRDTKLLKIEPYKISVFVMNELQPGNTGKSCTFCEWTVNNFHDGEINPNWNEAWFHLQGYINSQNYRYWTTEKPDIIHKIPLHDKKVGVWYTMSRERIVEPFLSLQEINQMFHAH